MTYIIECLIQAPSEVEVKSIQSELVSLTKAHGDAKPGDIEHSKGMFEDGFTAQFLLTVATSIATGVAANAIWSHLTERSENDSNNTQTDQAPDFSQPVTIKAKKVKIVININTTDKK